MDTAKVHSAEVQAHAAAATFEATSRTLDGEHPLHYHELGEGPPLVMLHGSGPGVSAWSNYRGNVAGLAAHFRVLALDMPGFGRSALPPLDRAYPQVAAEALVRWMDHLGIGSAHVLGNSMGGYVALEAALAAPERIDRLVLMGPGGLAVNTLTPEPSEGARRLSDFMLQPSRQAMAAWVDTMVANTKVVDDALIDERMANAMAPGAIASAVSIFMSLGQHPGVPLWARLGDMRVPTLVMWGRDDRMVPFEGGLFGYRRLPRAELHVFSRCGHWAQVERRAEFERLVVEFLTRP